MNKGKQWRRIMEQLLHKLEMALGSELGNNLAVEVVASIKKATAGSFENMQKMFFSIGEQWSPVLVYWQKWIEENALYRPVLMMRDVEPLTLIPGSSSWPTAWLNRRTCGIEDELSGDGKGVMNLRTISYIRQEELDKPFTFVDGGAWGTIVQELHVLGLEFQPLFFFSHNPHIPGFLNDLGIKKKDGELLNDSLECSFLKSVLRPLEFYNDSEGIVRPCLILADEEIACLSKATLCGIASGVKRNISFGNQVQAVEYLLELSKKARETGLFTGILPRNSPTWSNGDEFLENWPKNLNWV